MKVLVLILVLANLVLFGWLRWAQSSAPHIALQSFTQTGERLVLSTDPGFVQPVAPEPASTSPVAATASQTQAQAAPLCLTWGPVSSTVAGQLVARFKAAPAPMRQVVYTTQAVAAYRVEIADFANQASARQTATRIKQGGIQDLFLVRGENGQAPSLSLGVFDQYDHATQRANKVRALGFEPKIHAIKDQRQRDFLQMRLPAAHSVKAAVRAAGVERDPWREQCDADSIKAEP